MYLKLQLGKGKEVQTEVRDNAGATARFDYAGDDKAHQARPVQTPVQPPVQSPDCQPPTNFLSP